MLGSTTTNAMGTFAGNMALAFTVPLSPTGTYPVVSVGQSSGAVVTSTFTIMPSLTITPVHGVPGSVATIVGIGYGAKETVTIKWNCGTATCGSTLALGARSTNASGDFNRLHVTIPTTATIGTYPVAGIGKVSRAFAKTMFKVT